MESAVAVHANGLDLLLYSETKPSILRTRSFDTMKGTTADCLLRDDVEPYLYLIEPRSVGGSIVYMKPGTCGDPAPHLGMLVSGIVVDHEMDIQGLRDIGVYLLEEAKELLMPMSPSTARRTYKVIWLHHPDCSGQLTTPNPPESPTYHGDTKSNFL
jgi:hypothetical protein